MANDLDDLDKAEGGPEATQDHLLVGIQLGHCRNRLPLRWLVASRPQVQVDPAALELKLVDFALTVALTARLEAQHLQVAGEVLQLSQHFSHSHTLSVAVPAP